MKRISMLIAALVFALGVWVPNAHAADKTKTMTVQLTNEAVLWLATHQASSGLRTNPSAIGVQNSVDNKTFEFKGGNSVKSFQLTAAENATVTLTPYVIAGEKILLTPITVKNTGQTVTVFFAIRPIYVASLW